MAVDTKKNGLRVPFGLRQGRLYSPQGTVRGLACGCTCPGCGSRLIANQGSAKQPYFSHYQSRECSGGYESAVHLMAKQIVRDRGYIVIPEYRETKRKTMPTGEVLSEEIVVPSKRLEFADVSVEQTIDGLRPDVIGVTSDGAEVLIEVYVTHAVSDDKRERFAKRNLIELDLSMLPKDLVSDETMFAEEVLSGAHREWIACQLYDDETRSALKALRAKTKRFIVEHRARAEQLMIERQAEADRLRINQEQRRLAEEMKAQIEDRKAHLRERYSQHLTWLHNHNRYQRSAHQRMNPEMIETITHRLGCADFPEVLTYEQDGDWIFKVHRATWQAFIYERFIRGQSGRTLRANEIKRAIVRDFGMLEWINELIILKYQYKVQGRSRGQWYGRKGVWFFTDAENRMIPSPFILVLNYLKMLAKQGMLALEHPAHDSFVVRLDSFVALGGYKSELAARKRLAELGEQQAALERRRNLQAEAERTRQAEFDRRQKHAEDSRRRIRFLIGLVDSLYAGKGVREVKRCNHCSHFQELTDGDSCVMCSCPKLWDVTLSPSYLKTLPYRLRSLRLFPPSAARKFG